MEDRSNDILTVTWLFLALTWFTIILRVYVRGYLLSNTWGKDDWSMVATILVFTTYLACQIVAAIYGAGRHRWDLKDENARIALFFCYLCELLYILANCILKFSLLFFYLRVAIKRWHIWTIRIMMTGAVVFSIACIFLVAFQCSPVDEFWNNHPASEKCFPKGVAIGITYSMSAINAVADWTIGILPFFIVWSLRMNRKTKFLVVGILAFAAIGSTAAIIRMRYVSHLMNGPEFLYATADITIWTTIEPGVGIAAGNIATLRPFIRSLLGREESTNASGRESRQQLDWSSNCKGRHGYQKSLSPSEFISTAYSGTNSTKIFAQKLPLGSIPERLSPDDMLLGLTMEKNKKASPFDRFIQQTVTVEHVYESIPRLHLRDSFRDSFGRGTIRSLGRYSGRSK